MTISSNLAVQAIAKFTRRKPEELSPHVSLRSLGISSSFGVSALRSLIEAGGGRKLPPIDVNMTVAQLAALADGAGAPVPMIVQAPVATPVAAPAAFAHVTGPTSHLPPPSLADMAGQIGLGLDMQEIATFPLVSDYRADPFYAGHFHPSEIATAALRPDPRATLCGLFCAKEAAKKSHPSLLDLRMDAIVVSHDATGRPALRLLDAALDNSFSFVISITHAAHFAAATCLTLGRTA